MADDKKTSSGYFWQATQSPADGRGIGFTGNADWSHKDAPASVRPVRIDLPPPALEESARAWLEQAYRVNGAIKELGEILRDNVENGDPLITRYEELLTRYEEWAKRPQGQHEPERFVKDFANICTQLNDRLLLPEKPKAAPQPK